LRHKTAETPRDWGNCMTDRLTRVAIKRTDVVGKFWKQHLPMTCHSSVLLWLFEAEYNKSVTDAVEFASIFTGKYAPTQFMSLIATKGTKVPAPSGGGTAIAVAGFVLVFVDANGNAGHSCVTWSHGMIVGYNQGGWFKGDTDNKAQDHGFSAHAMKELVWVGDKVKCTAGDVLYTLVAVKEDKARKYVRAAVSRSDVKV